MLRCSKCKEQKPSDHFYRKTAITRGYNYHCKTCADSYDTKANSRRTSKRYYERHKSKSFAKSARYRASKLKACPEWLTEDMKRQIDLIYEEARSIGDCHVDHIVPLKGKNVCGLHVPWNLQILTAEENLHKSNKVDYDQ